jgi:hypothetical protein
MQYYMPAGPDSRRLRSIGQRIEELFAGWAGGRSPPVMPRRARGSGHRSAEVETSPDCIDAAAGCGGKLPQQGDVVFMHGAWQVC